MAAENLASLPGRLYFNCADSARLLKGDPTSSWLDTEVDLTFSVCKAQRTIRELVPQIVSPTAASTTRASREIRQLICVCQVYAAASVEFLVAEALNSIIDQMNELGNHRITPRHVKLAILRDEDFFKLFGHVIIPHGGTLPNINVELLFSRHRLRMGKSTRRKLEREESDEEKKRKEEASEESDTSVFTSLSKLPSDPPSTNGTRTTSRPAKQPKEKGKKPTTSYQTTVDTASESDDDAPLPPSSYPPLRSSGGAKKSSTGKTESTPILVAASDSDSDSDKENLFAIPLYRSQAQTKPKKKLGPPGRAIKGRKRQPSQRRSHPQESSLDSSDDEASTRPPRKTAPIPGNGKRLEAVNQLVEALIEDSSESDDREDYSMAVDIDKDQPSERTHRLPVLPASLDSDDDLDELSSSPPRPRSNKGKGRASVSSSSIRCSAARKPAPSQASSLPYGSPPASDEDSPRPLKATNDFYSPLREQFDRTRVSVSRSRSDPLHSPGTQGANGTSSVRTTPTNSRLFAFDSQTQNSALQHPLSTQEVDRLKTPSLNYSQSPAIQSPVVAPARPSSSHSAGAARKTIPTHVVARAQDIVEISSDEEEGPRKIIEIGSSDDEDEPVVLSPRPTVKTETTIKKEGTAAPPSG